MQSMKLKIEFAILKNHYDDLKKKFYCPIKMSNFGPFQGTAIGDVNKDGLDDCLLWRRQGVSGDYILQKTIRAPSLNRPTRLGKKDA